MSNLSGHAVRRSAAEWREPIDHQRNSGRSQNAFGRTHGVSPSPFQRRLRDHSTLPAVSAWLELPPGPRPPEGHREIELELGDGMCLRLAAGSRSSPRGGGKPPSRRFPRDQTCIRQDNSAMV